MITVTKYDTILARCQTLEEEYQEARNDFKLSVENMDELNVDELVIVDERTVRRDCPSFRKKGQVPPEVPRQLDHLKW